MTAPAAPVSPTERVSPAAPGASGPAHLATDDRDALRAAVLAWYGREGRRLEFRTQVRTDPWAVLVSEVMAQQTQVSRVEERWPAFMARFPSPAAMAAASPADVIRAWRGLGYNRRALRLHRAAVAIAADGGAVPSDLDRLQALPGIGPYTARAVAAIAFARPVGAVDVNVRRVLGRVLAGDPRRLTPSALQAQADALVDPARPATWTSALMDLGATVCRPDRPACPTCPARPWCAASAGPDEKAADVVARTRPRQAPTPFHRTTRWLRGRIIDQLRDAPVGALVAFDGPMGRHRPEAVRAALAALARDGLVELGGAGRARLAGSGAAT